MDQTFFYTSILFYITGMGFGTSYSLVYVDCLDWVYTRPLFRVIRGVLGTCISGFVYWLFLLIPSNDNPTKFFFHYGLPAILISFFIYGVFPIICLRVGLVMIQQDSYLQTQEQAFIKKDGKMSFGDNDRKI